MIDKIIIEDTKCLVEIDEVLNHLEKEDLNKIPIEIRRAIKGKKDKNYNWKYDEFKELTKQKLNRKSIAILAYLNMEYLTTDEQREVLEKIHEFNENHNS